MRSAAPPCSRWCARPGTPVAGRWNTARMSTGRAATPSSSTSQRVEFAVVLADGSVVPRIVLPVEDRANLPRLLVAVPVENRVELGAFRGGRVGRQLVGKLSGEPAVLVALRPGLEQHYLSLNSCCLQRSA